MKAFFSVLIFVLIAIPFVYMMFDVTRDIVKQVVEFYRRQGRPLLQSIFQILFN